MAKMKSETLLDYAVFQLSPKRSRCELFVSSDGSTEKLASGLVKPFVAHLKVAEEQVASAAQSVKLEPGRHKNADAWFTKGTLERFVRFVSTPEALELVNTLDAEMSQLEAARRIYSQGAGDQLGGAGGAGVTTADDATKKELLRAIDVRLVAVQQDLSNAAARAAAAGFNIDTVSELQMFADRFSAYRLNEACGKFLSLCERRPDLANPWRSRPEDQAVRSSYGSDMSIDDDPPSPPPRQEPANPVSATFPLRRTFSREPSVERDDGNNPNDSVQERDKKNENSTPEPAESIRASLPGRRLSVQDRINMFENKQKENSGGKPVVAKPVELRRLSSDVSSSGAAAAAAVEKAVLRRWSGASDMSIDLSADKKDSESPLCTPSSELVSQDKKVLILTDDTAKTSAIVKPEMKAIPSLARGSDGGVKEVSSSKPDQFPEISKPSLYLGSGEIDALKDRVRGKVQSRSLTSRSNAPENITEKYKMAPGGNESVSVSEDQAKLKGSRNNEEVSGPHTPIDGIKGQPSGRDEISYQKEESESTNGSVAKTKLKAGQKTGGDSGVSEVVAGSRIREAFAARYKGIEIERESSPAPLEISSVEETESVVKKESRVSGKVSSGSLTSVEDYAPQRMKLHRGPTAEMSKKARVQRNDSGSSGNNRVPFSGKVVMGAEESSDSFSTPPPEQIQRVRQSKGNQELNDELKMKANELEKLFAEHKLRVPGDQSNSVHKGKPSDTLCEPRSSLQLMKPAADVSPQLSGSFQTTDPAGSSKNRAKFNVPSLTKTAGSRNADDVLTKNFSELSVSEGSRGKFYYRYMQKRDAKLREEWSSNRVEKEAKLKSLQDSLEKSRSEMKSKLSGSADKLDSTSTARRRAERLRSYNSRSIMKTEQEHIKFEDSEDGDETLNDTFVDDISGGFQVKRPLPNNRNLSSSTPRTAASPVSRSSKISTISSGKRRLQPDNPLAQSVPNFSDLRKENTKPSSGGSKTSRTQVRNYIRSKNSSEDAALVKDDKSHRSQSLRKSSANPSELKDMSSLDADGVALTPIKFDEEVLKSVGAKPFLKKGSRTGSAARSSIAKPKGFMVSEPINNVLENDDLSAGTEEIGSVPEDGAEGEFETSNTNTESHKLLDSGEPTMLLESDKFVNSESENGDSNITFSRVDQVLGSHLPTKISSSFLPVESMQDWPGESPVSWNSRTQHPFSYPHEMSDIDASVDSPIGSPASWNSHPLNQMENDAARMRKKWGIAQKPMLVSNASSVSRKDMTRGFKRLLKFGWKNRGSETLVDWISVTTSEGDDDTEDGRDPGNRSSEDLRKSRMRFSQAQPSDDGFNDSELFTESDAVPTSDSSIAAPPSNFKLREDHMSGSSIKAPRSFFSLSTFRSKGSESKLR